MPDSVKRVVLRMLVVGPQWASARNGTCLAGNRLLQLLKEGIFFNCRLSTSAHKPCSSTLFPLLNLVTANFNNYFGKYHL